jgi:hypothetical protein
MVLRRSVNSAALRGVPIKSLREEFASRMARRLNDAAMKDATIMLKRGEYVSRMALS